MTSALAKKTGDTLAADFEIEKTAVVPLSRLDTLWPGLKGNARRPHLKLDVQGFEMHAFRGAAAMLAEVHSIEVELNIHPMYEGQPPFDTVYHFLIGQGFKLRQVWPHFFDLKPGVMADFDGMFVREA